MKRLYIAAAFIVLVITACTLEQINLNSFHKNVAYCLDAMEECAENDDYDGAYSVCCKLDEYYQRKYKSLSMTLYNNRLDEFNVTVHELKALAKNHDKTLKSKLLSARIQSEQIKTDHTVSPENIL